VDVEVEDGLSGAGADVEDGAVSLLDVALARDLGGGEVAAANDFGVGGFRFFQSGKMFLGNDEDMCGRLCVDVLEGEYIFIFVNFLGGNLAAEDAAEEAIRISHGWVTPAENNNTMPEKLAVGPWKADPSDWNRDSFLTDGTADELAENNAHQRTSDHRG
jgi:hypothetical protein